VDSRREIFGADSHAYKFEPRLSVEAAVAFEAKYDLALPEEYREYLLNVANGGAGPFYGLMALEDNDENTVHTAEPFPFEEPFYLPAVYEEVEAMTANMPEEEAEEVGERIFEEYLTKVDSGVSYLAHEGCGMYSVLVVKGPEAGNVWFVDLANDSGAFPLTDPETGEPFGFYDWFECWLDAALAHFDDGSKELASYANYAFEGMRFFGDDDDDEGYDDDD
jgi:hypothetical protein